MSVVSEVNTEVQTTMNLVLSELRTNQRKEDKMVKQKEFLQKCHKKAMKELKKAIQQKRKRQNQGNYNSIGQDFDAAEYLSIYRTYLSNLLIFQVLSMMNKETKRI